MKFIIIYVIVLLALFTNEVLSNPRKKDSSKKDSSKKGGKGFCKNKVLTGGKQIKEGSCSTTIQGEIPASNKMTSSFITFPKNEAVLESDKSFNVEVAINNLQTGFFSDPETQYYLEPQTLNHNGFAKGHSHVTIQKIDGSVPPNAEDFEFFKGLNDKSKKGHLATEVVRENGTPGLPAGKYRICAMSSSFTHQPLIMPVAKRGSQDDCIRITVEEKVCDKKNEEKHEGKKEEKHEGKKEEKHEKQGRKKEEKNGEKKEH